MSDDFDLTEVTPIFVSAKQVARMLGISQWTVYKLLDTLDDDGLPLIASQYQGSRRLIRYASVVAYADGLPTTARKWWRHDPRACRRD